NITINGQLDFINMMDVGYEKEHVLSIEIRGDELRKNLGAVKTELKRNPDVLDVCSSTYLPSRILDQTGMDWPGKIDKKFIETYTGEIDYDFIDLYGIEIIEGRNFSRDYPSDGANGAFLLNEAAVNLLGWENPVGREMIHWNGEQGKVVGIMKDFNFHSLHRKIEPLYLFLDPEERNNFISVKTRGENIRGLLAFIEKKMKDISPQYPFVYSFFDDVFESAYRSEQKIESIFRVFTFIAVFIACLGLFGLASYTAERRIKEIGIRKVLGANINKIVLLLTGNYIKWILAANVIAWPMGYYVMNKWLSNFAYRIEIGISVFFLSALIVLLIAVLTISIQTIKAAVSDPVRSLRYE
ncbi:MAG: FtsX-like permease family protein, partial [bacterium]|nr:FtsX-like permease family protein [bacterium]